MYLRILIFTVCMVILSDCNRDIREDYAAYFGNEEAIDLSAIWKVFEEYMIAEATGCQYELDEALEGDIWRQRSKFAIFDEVGAIRLPEYDHSEHPFLVQSEGFYNSCAVAFNIWSNHELWLRGCVGCELAASDSIKEGIRRMNLNCIREEGLQQVARIYRDSMLCLMQTSPESWSREGDAMDLLMDYSKKIELRAYQFYEDKKSFLDSLKSVNAELLSITRPVWKAYQEAEEKNRLSLILRGLSDCQTFDEQCSLWLNWANSQESIYEGKWIVAVAEALMKSGKYCLLLNEVWMIWRCLFQVEYMGLSRDSSIPNDYYNDMRKRCYLTCLKRIESHPEDVFAMNCASTIGGRSNLNRFGGNPMGNEAMVEEFYHLPHRFNNNVKEELERDEN